MMKYHGISTTSERILPLLRFGIDDKFWLRRKLRRRGVMGRILTVTASAALLYFLYFLEYRRCPCSSSGDKTSILSNGEGQHSLQQLRGVTDAQGVDDNHDEESGRTDLKDLSPLRPSLPGFSGVNKELPSCASNGGRAKSFLVIFMGHSGSSAIISELRNHSKVLIERSEPIDHYQYEFNTTLALKYTRELFSRGKREGKVAGFKMRPWHIGQRPNEWAALAKEFNTRIIWQYRKNILKQAVGEYSKKYYDDNSSVEGLRNQEEVNNRCKTGAGCRFKIEDFDFFHRTLKDCLHSDLAIARGVDRILDGGKCVFDLPYEDYLYHREETMRTLQRFLGVDYKETAPKRFKATSDSLCEVIENWDEVCEKFYGCHVWRHMFDDAHNGCSCDFSSGSTTYCDTVYKS